MASSSAATAASPPPPINVPAPASTSIAASRPRRSSSNNNSSYSNNHTSSARSSSMNRQAASSSSSSATGTSPMATRSRGLSGSGSSPYSHSIADDRRQSKFEKLFGSGAGSGSHTPPPLSTSSPSSSLNNNGNGFVGGLGVASASSSSSYGAPTSAISKSAASSSSNSVAKSGISLTRRISGASSTTQKPVPANGHGKAVAGNSNGSSKGLASSSHITPTIRSSSQSAKAAAAATAAISKSELDEEEALEDGEDAGNKSSGADKELLRCERCHKVYHHPQSLIKHRWQHTEMWSDASKYGLSKHQTVQALEAAVILANPDTLRLLPNDKSHWPAAVSPPTSGLLGSEKLNIEILRKQAEVNERELAEQERAGTLRPTGAFGLGVVNGNGKNNGNGMQMYSKSMPANVGRRRSGLSFSFQQEMMDEQEDEEEEESMVTEMDDEEEEDDDDDQDDDDEHANEDADVEVDTADIRGTHTGAGDIDDDDSTESEDESVIASATGKQQQYPPLMRPSGADQHLAQSSSTDMDSMDQDMFSLDISSSSPYMRSQVLPLAGSAAAGSRSGLLSYSRKTQATPSIGPSAERYTFLPTIPSSASLHMAADGFGSSGMSAIPTTSGTTRTSGRGGTSSSRHRSSSHTRSTKRYDTVQERGMRENSTSSSTDESGASASANEGTNTTAGSGDESRSYATRDSGYVSNGHVGIGFAAAGSNNGDGQTRPVKGEMHDDDESTAAALYTLSGAHRPTVNPMQTATISMSAPVLGFFTERSPASSFTSRGILPARQQQQQAGMSCLRDGASPTSNKGSDYSPSKQQSHPQSSESGGLVDPATSQATAIPEFSPLEAQAAEILSSSHHSQHSLQSGPRSYSHQQQQQQQPTHFGSYTRSPGFHPYRSSSPFLPSSRQLPSSFAQAQAQQLAASPSPSPASGQAYSFGQAPLGSSFRSTSFTGNGSGFGNAYAKHNPLSPLAKPVDANGDGPSPVDDDEIMDMDL